MYLTKAASLEAACKLALSEEGSSNVQHVKLAHADDINWVKSIGGHVPERDPELPGCGFSHPDVAEDTCSACGGNGWFICESEGDR